MPAPEATSTQQFLHLTPILVTQDITKTIHYYQRTLGFEKVFDYGDPVFYAGVSRDGFDLHFSRRDQASVLPERDSESVDIYIPTTTTA